LKKKARCEENATAAFLRVRALAPARRFALQMRRPSDENYTLIFDYPTPPEKEEIM